MVLKGKIFKFGDDINTDFIISGRYKFKISDMKQLSKYLFEDIRPGFYKQIKAKSAVIAAGSNFGMGSSREQAPWVIKEAGISCIIAKSFARIFYRNAFNIGLPLIEADTSSLKEGETVTVNVNKGLIKSNTNTIKFLPWDGFQKELINSGGIIKYLQKHGGFAI